MRVDKLTLRWSGILLGILFIAATLSACGDSGGSAPQSTPVGSSPGQSDSTDSMSLDDYIAWCSDRGEPEFDDQNATLRGSLDILWQTHRRD